MNRYYPKKNNQGWTKLDIQKEIDFWKEEDSEGNLREYLQVAFFYLKQKLNRVA